ncbi:MAG: phosphopyruvate hydratase [Candidatus Paceibacterota bacterium]|jgi:enolase
MKIKDIRVSIIKNSRNEDALEVELLNDSGLSVIASVPQGASTGEREAISLSAENAIEKINGIVVPEIKEKSFESQDEFDDLLCELDGTNNKSRLGANATLVLSLAFARLLAKFNNQELYEYIAEITHSKPSLPAFYANIIEGGKHAKNNLDWQEYLIVVKDSSAENQLKIAKDVFENIGNKVKTLSDSISFSDEGAYDLNFENNTAPLELINSSIKELDLEGKVMLALDVAADSFYKNNEYTIDGSPTSVNSLTNIYNDVVNKYPVVSIEDPYEENDFEHYATLNTVLNDKNIFIVGDDLTTTNTVYIEKAVLMNSISGIIIKPNQIGTLTETLEAIKIAKENNLKIIVSHRSGETEDSFIADLAYGIGAYGLKAGAPSPKERLAKYDRIIEIDKIQYNL